MTSTLHLAPATVDPLTSSAHLTAGCTWRDVIAAAAQHGLVAVHAFDQSRRAVESVLRNDFSPYSRLLGFSADTIRTPGPASELAAGLEIELFPMAGGYSGGTFWDVSDAHLVVPLWMEWARTAPNIATTRLSLVTSSGREPGTWRSLLKIDGLVAIRKASDASGSAAVLDGLLDPLLAAANPLASRWPLCTNRLRHVDAEGDSSIAVEVINRLNPGELIDMLSEAVSAQKELRLNQLGGQMNVGRFSGRPDTHPAAAFELVPAADPLGH